MFKWLKRLLIFFILIYLLFIAVAGYYYYRSRVQTQGTLILNGLHGKVTVIRDSNGIPHITAEKNDLDAFYALGYVHAQDRFWQMEFNRRVAQGTLSELFGKKTLTDDEYLRTWGFYRAAQESWPALSPQAKAIIQSYTDGVNAYIQQKHFPLQIVLLNDKPAPWTVIDTLAWQKILAWDLQSVWESKYKNYMIKDKLGESQIAVLFPAYPKNAPTILSDADLKQSNLFNVTKTIQQLNFVNMPDKGSNNWVLSGKWTTSGKPLLANDPHLELQSPALWYLAELKGPTLHVIGATMPGMPGVVIGHNDHIAWGLTNVNPDVQDLYILPLHSSAQLRKEIIKVRGEADVVFPVIESNVGPVISGVTDTNHINRYVALRWTALEPGDTTVQSLVDVDYAQNWQQFTQALKYFVAPSQNFVYADTEGNIGYYVPGKIPVRNFDDALPVTDDSQHQWQGYIPFEKLPHVYNPPEGYIVSANNRVVNDNYPYEIALRWSTAPFRAERIIELLKQNRPIDTVKSAQIQLDTVSLFWKAIKPDLLNTKPLDQNSIIALNYLKSWQGDADLNSIPQTIFAYWYREFADMLPAQIKPIITTPDPLFILEQIQTNGEYCRLKNQKNCGSFLSQTLQNAMKKLIADQGNDPKNWTWGKVHYAVFDELGFGNIPAIGSFWQRKIATPGSLYSVNVGTYDFNTFVQRDGAGYRQIIDLNNFDHSLYIQSLGQSNDPLDKHYDDFLKRWRDGEYLSMKMMGSGNSEKNSHILTLMPSKKE